MKLDIHYLFSMKHAKWALIGLMVLFSLLIIGEFCSLLFLPTPIAALAEPTNPAQPPNQNNNAKELQNSSLFGVYVSNDLSDDNVKKSMIDVTLVGVLMGNNENDSQVIIRGAGGEERTYQISDKLPGGVTIKRIMGEGIIVEHNGELERLSLPKNDLIFEPVPQPLKEEK